MLQKNPEPINSISLIHQVKSRIRKIRKSLQQHARSERFISNLPVVSENFVENQFDTTDRDHHDYNISKERIYSNPKLRLNIKFDDEPEIHYTPFSGSSSKKYQPCERPCIKQNCYCNYNLINYSRKKHRRPGDTIHTRLSLPLMNQNQVNNQETKRNKSASLIEDHCSRPCLKKDCKCKHNLINIRSEKRKKAVIAIDELVVKWNADIQNFHTDKKAKEDQYFSSKELITNNNFLNN